MKQDKGMARVCSLQVEITEFSVKVYFERTESREKMNHQITWNRQFQIQEKLLKSWAHLFEEDNERSWKCIGH